MSDDIQVRTVTVELLRAGPAHNQLLSPLTQYLGVCDDAEAGIVTLPFEHAAFLRRMKSMRYTAGTDDAGRSDRLPVLRELGVEMAKLLGTVPRLPGSLSSDAAGPDTLVHLRLVLSASELASLPFEQAKIPIGPSSCGEGWLSLQARVPVVITRRTRNVSEGGVKWPTQPRILFVSADPSEVPFDKHKPVLVDAVRPYLKPGQEEPVLNNDGHREQFGELLTILKNATFEQVVEECATQRYSHIHILAHGAEDPATEEKSYGLALRGSNDDAADVISGERLASALACLVGGAIHRPSVVVLATCDSANQASVMTPGASIAHVLHQAGIAMVVASQFPLSKEGSVLLAREFYPGLLRGENPWILLHRIRTGLHGRVMAHSHDWASLVVYEALPANLAEHLEDLRYLQGKRAINVAIDRIDRAVAASARSGQALAPDGVRGHEAAVQTATGWLPMDGRFAMECLGLRASSKKRLAEAEFNIACAAVPGAQAQHMQRSVMHLEQSLDDYEQAVNSILVNKTGQAVQRVSSLHWVLVQQLSLSMVLGKPFRPGAWETARLSAEAYLGLPDVDERAWALGSLIELWLIRVASTALSEAEREQASAEARRLAGELVKLYRASDAMPIQSTAKQLKRYVHWWCGALFESVTAQQNPAVPAWNARGVADAATLLVGILDSRNALERIAQGERDEPALARAAAALAPAPVATAPPAVENDAGGNLGASTPPQNKVSTQRPAADAGTVFTIDMLPADHGDCLWLEYGQGTALQRVLVDCGTDGTYPALRDRIAALPPKARGFELFILTHIDDDHIGGAIPFLKDQTLGVGFGDIWFNGWKHLRPGPQTQRLGAMQGEAFSALIEKYKHPWNQWRNGGTVVLSGDTLPTHVLPGGMRLTLLSPSPDKLEVLRKKWQKDVEAAGQVPGRAAERLGKTVPKSTDVNLLAKGEFDDDAPHNGSSIAVLAEYRGKAALLGADAHTPVLVDSIRKLLKARGEKKLKLDAFKVSHHASKNNISAELLALLDCKNYLVSTNGSVFNHPDREAIAKIIQQGGPQPTLWFNHRTSLNDVWADAALQKKYGYQAVYPEGDRHGRLVRLG